MSLTTETRDGLRAIRERLANGDPVLVDGGTARDTGLPAIQSVPDAEHIGMGAFEATHGETTVKFSAGGAMYRDGDVSWSPVHGNTSDRDEIEAALDALIDGGYDIHALIDRIDELLG